MADTQNLNNHARIVRAYAAAMALLLINFVWAIVRLALHPAWASVDDLLLALAVLIIGYYARHFALTAQDRIIRLEVRLRLEAVLPPELRARIGALSLDQLIALRFASDAELPAITPPLEQ
jgi:hypothetical protein